MVVIKIELWPHGKESRKKILGIGVITNDGTGSTKIGNYTYNFRTGDATYMCGTVTGFPRLIKNAWDLIEESLKSCK